MSMLVVVQCGTMWWYHVVQCGSIMWWYHVIQCGSIMWWYSAASLWVQVSFHRLEVAWHTGVNVVQSMFTWCTHNLAYLGEWL